jgi:hypothetical protein
MLYIHNNIYLINNSYYILYYKNMKIYPIKNLRKPIVTVGRLTCDSATFKFNIVKSILSHLLGKLI